MPGVATYDAVNFSHHKISELPSFAHCFYKIQQMKSEQQLKMTIGQTYIMLTSQK